MPRILLLLAALLLSANAAAQYPSRQTGTVTAEVDGRNVTAVTTATEVPANAADSATDENQRAILERVAGTTQHTASFALHEAFMLGGIQLTAERIWVTVSTETDHPDGSSFDSFLVQFALDPEKLQLIDEDEAEISFYPRGSSWSDYYALTEGSLQLDEVVVLDGQTLRITGSFSGLFSHQTGFDITHNPADVLSVNATFELSEVGASDVTLNLLQE